MTTNFFSHLWERKLIEQVNDQEGMQKLCELGPIDEQGNRRSIYCGFDPTAKSLTIGHLVPLLSLKRAQDFGYTPIILFGGATGMIGDPTGKQDMRPMSTAEEIEGYIENFKKLIQPFFKWDVENPPLVVNNLDWIGPMSWIDFTKKVGIHFTVARLLASEVNRSRMEAGGLTFMELSYQLIQAYDWVHLFNKHNCCFQIGGNDQWSNILAGADLLRRIDSKQAYCFTQPLITDKSGKKLGKTAGNAVWLDPELTSPYDLFQYFRNIPDEAVEPSYHTFSLRPTEEVTEICKHQEGINKTKEDLAFEITSFVHGEQEANKSREAAKALFSKEGSWENAPSTTLKKEELKECPTLIDLLIKTELIKSKGEGRRLIKQNGIEFNEKKAQDPQVPITEKDFFHESGGILLKKGKKIYHIVRLEE